MGFDWSGDGGGDLDDNIKQAAVVTAGGRSLGTRQSAAF
jgi:hypothetical protein